LPELGLTLSELTPKIRGSLGIPPETSGVLVLAVTEKGPATDKGLKGGDLILRVDQQTVKSTNQLKELAAADKRAGRKAILLLVERQGDVRFVTLSFNPS
jgi:serine protease Do